MTMVTGSAHLGTGIAGRIAAALASAFGYSYGAGSDNEKSVEAIAQGIVDALNTDKVGTAQSDAGGVPGSGAHEQALTWDGVTGAAIWQAANNYPVFGPCQRIQGQLDSSAATTLWLSGGGTTTTNFTHGGPGVRTGNLLTARFSYYEQIGAGVGGAGSERLNGFFRWAQRPKLQWLLRSPSSLATKRFWCALQDGDLAPLAPVIGTAASAIRHLALAYDSAVSANWILSSGDGANYSGIDTGVAVVADTDYRLALDATTLGTLRGSIFTGDAGVTLAYTGTKTSNVPTGNTTDAGMQICDTNLSGVAACTGFSRSAFLFEAGY